MATDEVSDVETALFGTVRRSEIDYWLGSALFRLTGARVTETLFRAGRIDVVQGVRTDDGRALVIKVHRPPVDMENRQTASMAQAALARHGFPCPEPVAGPAEVDGKVVGIETLLDAGSPESGQNVATRRATAQGLAEHMTILSTVPGLASAVGPAPAWCRYQNGPWPVPHDTFFDFTHTPPGHEWLDHYAERASDVLLRDQANGGQDIFVGHADWYCGNLRFENGRVVSAVDWDLVADTAPAIAGFSAGGYKTDAVPSPEDVAAYLSDFESAWIRPFTAHDKAIAAAAASWMLAFNARCDLALQDQGYDGNGALNMLQSRLCDFLQLNW